MAGFIQNIIWNSVEGFVEAGTRSAGEFAGNALIKAGDMIENGGRSVGNGIEKKATGYGGAISGQTYQPSPRALPSTARKPVVKRSNSLPASSRPSTGSYRSIGPKPLGANKYPGGNQVNGAKNAATDTTKSLGGGGPQKALPSSLKSTPLSKPGNLPKSYPTRANSLPKPYSNTSFPSEKKSVVKPGQPKPFTPPTEQKKSNGGDVGKKAYPGTNTLPGQGKRVPVQNQKMKALPRLGPQVGRGEKMVHLAV